MGIIGLISALLFLNTWISGTRNDKGVFGGDVWWKNHRLVHAGILLLFAINAL